MYDVSENTSLDVNIVDLSAGSEELDLTVNLSRGASCRINFASVCQTGEKKRISVNTVHSEGNTFSRTKMAGINLGDGSLQFLGTSVVPEAPAAPTPVRRVGSPTCLQGRRARSPLRS